MIFRLGFCATAPVVGIWPAVSRADSVWIGEAGRTPIENDGVKNVTVDGDTLSFTLDSGVTKKEPMARVQQISVDGETAFNAAEADFAADKNDTALTGYQAALSSGKDWIRARSAARLIGLAKARNKFDAQEAAYVQLVKSDPALAAANKPNKPAANTPGLDAALSSLSTGLASATLTVPQKSALLNQELEIYRAKNDGTSAAGILSKLNDLGATTPAEQAMLKVAEAGVACDNKDWAKATALIQQNKSTITDQDLQVDALYVLARALDGQTGAAGDDEKKKNVALAYMRVVTFGEKRDGKPHVAESLLKTAQIEESLKDTKAATSLYQQIVDDRDLKQTPEAGAAKTALERLKAAGN